MIEIHASGTLLEWLVTIIVGSFIWGFAWGAGRDFYNWTASRRHRKFSAEVDGSVVSSNQGQATVEAHPTAAVDLSAEDK